MSQTLALPRALELPGGGRLPRLGAVDAVALEARAGELAKRSIKRESKVFALELAIRMMDLTTLEGADTPGKVKAMSAKAMHPDPGDPSVPSVAAVCVYPSLVSVARRALRGSGVKVASVATAFPSGQAPHDVKLDGWALLDTQKQRLKLSGVLRAGATLQVKVQQPLALSNKGGIVTLVDEKNLKVDGVSYTKAQARNPGWTLVF